MNNKELVENEIRSAFNFIDGDAVYRITTIDKNFPSFVISEHGYKGVAFETDKTKEDFYYSFENISILGRKKTINNQFVYLIELLTNDDFDDIFATICLDFLDVGYNGEKREQIKSNPQVWIDKWKKLIGNKSVEKRVYDYIGELLVLKSLLEANVSAQLTNLGSHDIDTPNYNVEVKTSTIRHGSIIEVHSPLQLKKLNGKDLYLYYVRLEESLEGISLLSLVDELEKNKYPKIHEIKEKIKDINTVDKEKNYKIDEVRKYSVDDDFPKITSEEFKSGKIPQNIVNISYTINLDGLKYENVILGK